MRTEVDILAFAAHPDDVELSSSGTLMKHIDAGMRVGIVDLTQGELGSRGSIELRHKEAEVSSKIMGVHHRVNLKMEDGFFEINEQNKLRIIEQIRRFRPKIVLANAMSDRHPDHGRASKLVSEACFLSGLIKIDTQWEGKAQQKHRPKAVYHYNQYNYIKPDFVIDVTEYFDRKMEAIKAFKSQFYDPDSKEPETPISDQGFFDFLKSRMEEYGRPIGVKYAEAFTVERTFGVDNLTNLI